MDGTNETKRTDSKGGSSLSAAIEARRENPTALFADAAAFFVSFLFAKCHLLFGAHPLAIALLSALPSHLFVSLAGAVAGSLTLGGGGIIYGMVCGVVVFLRLAVSGGKRGEEHAPARAYHAENPLFRLCACIIAGFIISVYEVLLSGIGKATLIFALTTVISSPLLSALFSCFFYPGISITSLFEKGRAVFTPLMKQRDGTRTLVLFTLSLSALIFFLSLSLASFELLGISLSYVFSAVATLAAAKRFGWVWGGAVGFAAAIAVSPVQAVSFALSGLAAGLLFKIGISYAVAGGCVALSAWSAYSAGLSGFLAALPEYLLGAAIAYPIISKLPTSEDVEKKETDSSSARDMVGTMSLAYKTKRKSPAEELEIALSELAPIISTFGAERKKQSRDELFRIFDEELRKTLSALPSDDGETLSDAAQALRAQIIKKLSAGERLTASDLPLPHDAVGIGFGDSTATGTDGAAHELISRLNRRASELERDADSRPSPLRAEDYVGISKILSEARMREDAERTVDTSLSEKMSAVFEDLGFFGGVVRVMGDRYKHIIAAGEDAEGLRITSPEVKSALERVCGATLSHPEYYRRGSLVLMEATSTRRISAEFAFAEMQGSEKEISGDTLSAFESTDDRFFALISDGMGSGKLARDTSLFVCNFLRGALAHGFCADASLHILNSLIRSSGEECSATVDLFELDLMSGEARFLKCGASASYVKRGSSIFRIRSRTAPIGLMRAVDAERIRVEVKCEDCIIMLSDGINPTAEDAPWLLELLAKPLRGGAKELASLILEEAKKYSRSRDDASVLVVRLGAV